jgi:hypothetical protein
MILPQSSRTSFIKIIDALGREVRNEQLYPMQDRLQLNLDFLENGNYIILWTDDNSVKTEKLIIAR